MGDSRDFANRVWVRSLRAVAALVGALAAGAVLSAAAAAAPPDLTGSWINPVAPSAPAWHLQASSDLSTLRGTWTGGQGHGGLMGSFTATLNGSETEYTGTFHIDEAGNTVDGTITFTIETPDRVSITIQDTSCNFSCNMAPSTFTLDRAPATVIVGLGDSLASGEGNPDEPKRGDVPARWLDPRCDRSAKSYQAMTVARLRKAHPARQITFQFLACSGASIPIGLLGPYAGINPASPDLQGQVEVARTAIDGQKPNAVLLSAGVNDLQFGAVAQFCATYSNCMNRQWGFSGMTLSEWLDEQFAHLPNHYFQLAAAFHAAGWDGKRIFITQYPNLFNDSDGSVCARIHFTGPFYMTRTEALGLEGRLIELNRDIATAAHDYGWHLVKAPSGFNTHGYCAAHSWIVTYSVSKAQQGDPNGTLHPNLEGQTAIANQVYAAISGALKLH